MIRTTYQRVCTFTLLAAGLCASAASAGTFDSRVASVDLRALATYQDASGNANGGNQTYANTTITAGSFSESRTSTATTSLNSASLTEGISLTQSATLLSSTMSTRIQHPAMQFGVNGFSFSGSNAQEFRFSLSESTQVRFSQTVSSLFLNSALIWFIGPGGSAVFSQATAPPFFFPGTADITLAAGSYRMGYSVQPDYAFPSPGVNTLPATDVTGESFLSLEIIPAPSTAVLAGMSLLAAARRRR
ncbi:MAG TPA: hypothetical protein VK176_14035 [Phycisphaerales bacterium]|nr:hypothetical protein [Phycisphaerales bacterium]